MIGNVVSGLQNALLAKGSFTPQQALLFARVLLTRPGVTITKQGVRYKGNRYSAADFATTPLADFVTGAKAQADNQAAIKGDPGYLADLATLGLNRDQATAGLQDQYNRAVLNYGDPSFAGNNGLLGSQAAANPFSTSALLARAYQATQSQQANDLAARGLAGSGGMAAATQNTQRAYAGQLSSQVQALQDLLSTINQQRQNALSTYNVGGTTALQAAEQRLLASGQIHAAAPPTLSPGKFRVYHPPRPPRGAGGGGRSPSPYPQPPPRNPHYGGLAAPPPPRRPY